MKRLFNYNDTTQSQGGMKILFFAASLMIFLSTFSSCSDDDSFSTSRSNLLTFSEDTVSMDTVFSTVPSSTKWLMVHNESGDGIRLTSVRLERGNQTGFRVNVDGVYLDNSVGSIANDFEIRKGDSIRVYVELTSALTGQELPQLVEDNLVFLLESGVEQRVNLKAWSWDAQLADSLIIKRDTVIRSAKPIVVRRGMRVDSAATLIIAAPTSLYFGSGAALDVYGTLEIYGSMGKDVVLRGDRLDHMFDYLPYDRVSGQWEGIRIHASSTGNKMQYVDIHSAMNGIVCDSVAYDDKHHRLYLDHVTIHNCKGYGLKTINSLVAVDNCQISNTLDDCLAVYGGKVQLVYTTLAQFYPFDTGRGAALSFTNSRDSVPYPLHALVCYNTLVTGYADDVVMGEGVDSTAAFNYYFENCILRTPEPDSTAASKQLFVNTIFENPDSIEGESHFKVLDIDQQYYDFHLDSASTARKRAVTLADFTTDRDGVHRPDSADIGCYQFVEEQ